ncbi:phosphoribosyltransferase family protein [Actinomycetaceae bacterium MB13-C1-2]|nr:phosphoribosyltransferase family protein [Actinomycetaceae bacterium MB13-C1-2]
MAYYWAMTLDLAAWAGQVSRIHQTLQALIWSAQCAGCNKWDELLCSRCASLATRPPTSFALEDAQGIPSWPMIASGEYEGELRNILLAAKHDPVRDLSEFLFQSGYTFGVSLGKRLDVGQATQIWVVPTPSSKKRRQDRTEIVPFIAKGVQAGLKNALALRTDPEYLHTGARGRTVPDVRVVRAVQLRPTTATTSAEAETSVSVLKRLCLEARLRGGGGSQQGHGVRARGLARTGMMEPTSELPKNVRIVVVDDVCASGATLREVLRHVGNQTLAITVIAVSRPSHPGEAMYSNDPDIGRHEAPTR